MKRWVECVPNFSEGRDAEVISKIADAIHRVPGAIVLHVDSNEDANRTVITFVASPDAAVEAGFQGISAAATLIDMRRQTGAHPRIGATDVFPFIPLENTTFDDCIALAHGLSRRVSEELAIPVFLYGKAASTDERVRVPDIRRGGYEGLKKRIAEAAFKPDYGHASLPEKHGATIIGVRDFLLAYNVNLNTRDVSLAKRIARRVRTSGEPVRDDNGRLRRDSSGRPVRTTGRLYACQADGWLMPSYKLAQVTMNLLNFRTTGLHDAYEAVTEEAAKFGVETRGSELVGLVPKAALLASGVHFLGLQNGDNETEAKVMDAAVEGLGLSSIDRFEPEKRVLELLIRQAFSGSKEAM